MAFSIQNASLQQRVIGGTLKSDDSYYYAAMNVAFTSLWQQTKAENDCGNCVRHSNSYKLQDWHNPVTDSQDLMKTEMN